MPTTRRASLVCLLSLAFTGCGGGGGQAAFLDFIRSELIPFVEANIGGDPARRVLLGHSHGGSFVLYALFAEAPDAHHFSAYLASASIDAILFAFAAP